MVVEIPLPDKVTVEDIRNMIAGIQTRDTQKRTNIQIRIGGRGVLLIIGEEEEMPTAPIMSNKGEDTKKDEK